MSYALSISLGPKRKPDTWEKALNLSGKLFTEEPRLDKNNLDKLWRNALKEAGIRQIRFHDLRHTFASQLIEQGAHPKYIQEQLGHASITMTMDTYGHLFPNRNRGLSMG